jgi:pSer/pThr/pTyr-binding forkhead associated (FHA) protein
LSTFRPRDAAASEVNPPRSDTVLWTLRFISGKYQGGEFPLRPHREIVIGRSSDLDMVLVEDMVSRKHAKIVTEERTVSIQDLGSTNGTFVNGEKIRKVELKDGDRILIGTSIIKLVALDGQQATAPAMSETEARSKMQSTANRRPAATKSMSGSIEEIPLPDLLQLLSTSRKSGVIALRSDWGTGRIYLRKGQIYFATIDESFDVGPRKAMYRMLTWTQGFFELEPPDERAVLEEIQDSTEGLLMEGMRQLDEFRELQPKLPPLTAKVSVPRPLLPRLRELKPEELDIVQAALSGDPVQTLLDASRQTDLEAAQALLSLIDRGYIQASG